MSKQYDEYDKGGFEKFKPHKKDHKKHPHKKVKPREKERAGKYY